MTNRTASSLLPTSPLADYRRRAGVRRGKGRLSIAEVARQIGYSRGHLSAVEHGRKTPSPELLAMLAPIYGVSAEELAQACGLVDA